MAPETIGTESRTLGSDRDDDERRPWRDGPARIGRRLAAIVIVLVVVWSAAAIYMPPLVVAEATRAFREHTGRELTIGRADFSPWTLELELHDIAVAAAAGSGAATAQVEVKRIRVDAAASSLVRWAPVVDAIVVDAPTLRIRHHGDGRLDIDDIRRRLAERPPAPHGDPARFALHNIVVRGGSVDWSDEATTAVHRVRDLELAVPFLSSLAAEREVTVEPRLAFALDGTRFDSAAAATPFAGRGNGVATLRLDRIDLQPYLAYAPASWPVRVRSAALTADLRIAFEQRPRLAVRVSGTVAVEGVKVVDPKSDRLLDVGSTRVDIEDLRPLEASARLRRIDVDAPHVVAVRDAGGRVNLLVVADGAGGTVAVAKVPLPSAASAVPPPSASASTSMTLAAKPRWTLALGELAVRAGRLDWRDATTRPTTALSVADLRFDARSIGWPLDAPVQFEGDGTMSHGHGAASKPAGRFVFSGRGDAGGAAFDLAVKGVPLDAAAPYLRDAAAVPIAGDLTADVAVTWKAGGAEPQIRVAARKASLANVVVGDPASPELAVEAIEIADATVDTASRRVGVGSVSLVSPRLRLARDRDGAWRHARGVVAPRWTATAEERWQIALSSLAVGKGRVAFSDDAAPVPIAIDVVDLALTVTDYAVEATPRPDAVSKVQLTARISAPIAARGNRVSAAASAATSGRAATNLVGSVDVRGELGGIADGVPSSARLRIAARDLPLHVADRFLDAALNLDIQRAQTAFTGDVSWQRQPRGDAVRVRGDVAIDDFRATSLVADRAAPRRALAMTREGAPAGRTLLSWRSLALRSVDVKVAPEAPPEIVVEQTAIVDFFARVLLDEDGRLNLQDVVRRDDAKAAAGSADATAAAAAAPARIRFGPITVAGGRVSFTDRFVRPNYTADLSELSGRLGGFSATTATATSTSTSPPGAGDEPQLADLALTGRVEGSASLEITGRVNPLATPLALDIKALVRDLELPPLTPYAIKYAGYGIERGKMSVDVAYLVRPDGQLTASNRIVLNQLAFGDRVEGASASLPVKLAVALLADRRGVIDLDLPIGGSINDPQFSLGGIVWQAIKNIVVKAVTAPFSLLASAVGGGSETMSQVEFFPGTAQLKPASQQALDKVADALAERPALSLTVTGESRIETERDAWKRDRLEQIVRAEKRRQAIAGGAAATVEVTVSEPEYATLLREVYRRADIPGKPKNALGAAIEQTPAEMEALLLANITIADDAMQQLATRRGVAVRDYLAAKNLPTSRLFLGAPRTSGSDENWTPRADLKLQSS